MHKPLPALPSSFGGNRTLWESGPPAPVAARIAIAGDFIPSGRLCLPAGRTWREMASQAAPLFAGTDAGIFNLECVLDSRGLSPRPLNGLGAIVSAPSAALDYPAALGLPFAGVANNHAFDYGPAGAARTLAAVSSRGMIPLGAGRSLRDSPSVHVWENPARNVRVGFWAAARATHDPSAALLRGVEPATPSRARAALHLLRARGAQFCIALLHAGCLRTSYPAPEDASLLDSLAAAGFDVVAASHSHLISGARAAGSHTRPAFCFYGLGSLASGYVASPIEAEGLVVIASLAPSGSLARLEVRPLSLDPSGWAGVPSPEAAVEILARFDGLSRHITDGSFAARFYRDMSQSMFATYWRDVRAAFGTSGIRGLVRKARRARLLHVKRLVRAVVG